MKKKTLIIGVAIAALVGVLALAGCSSSKAEPVTSIEAGGNVPTIDLSKQFKDAEYVEGAISASQQDDDMIIRLKTESKDAPDIEVYRWAKDDNDGVTDLAEQAANEAAEYESEAVQAKYLDTDFDCFYYEDIEKVTGKDVTVKNYVMEDGEDFVEVCLVFKSVLE